MEYTRWNSRARRIAARCCVREAKEETGLDIEIDNIIYESSNYDTSKDKVFTKLIYGYKLIGDMKRQLAPEGHSDYRWVSVDDVMDNPEIFVDCMADLIKVKHVEKNDVIFGLYREEN